MEFNIYQNKYSVGFPKKIEGLIVVECKKILNLEYRLLG